MPDSRTRRSCARDADPAARSASPTIPAAIGIARSARDRPAGNGLPRAQDELLPVAYFHVVFTLPAPIAAIAFQNKAAVYAILFKAAAETLRTIAADPKHLGAEIGLIAVLHSWGQNLHYHPHIHCIVPGGGLSPDHMRWISCRPGFFLPVRVLSRLFRRLFLQELRAAYRSGQAGASSATSPNWRSPPPSAASLPRSVASSGSSTPSRHSADRKQVLAYLGRYTHRVAIANSRLISLADGKVTFRWRDYRHRGKAKLMTLEAHEFITALPAAHPAGRLPSHPPLRLPRKRPSRRKTRIVLVSCWTLRCRREPQMVSNVTPPSLGNSPLLLLRRTNDHAGHLAIWTSASSSLLV